MKISLSLEAWESTNSPQCIENSAPWSLLWNSNWQCSPLPLCSNRSQQLAINLAVMWKHLLFSPRFLYSIRVYNKGQEPYASWLYSYTTTAINCRFSICIFTLNVFDVEFDFPSIFRNITELFSIFFVVGTGGDVGANLFLDRTGWHVLYNIPSRFSYMCLYMIHKPCEVFMLY